MSTTPTHPTRRWRLALVAALVAGPLFGAALGTAWAAQTFPDVPPSHTFSSEIEWGARYGIINGYPDGTFRPGQPVTRAQSAAFLSHYNDTIHIVTRTVPSGSASAFFSYAQCPVGERAIGGSGNHSGSNLFITDTHIVGRQHSVRWETDNDALLDPGELTVNVVCAPDPATAD